MSVHGLHTRTVLAGHGFPQRAVDQTGDVLGDEQVQRLRVLRLEVHDGGGLSGALTLGRGYNSNVTKLVTRHPQWKKEDLDIYCLGNKGRETFVRNGYAVKECDNDIVESPVCAPHWLWHAAASQWIPASWPW